MITKKRKIHTTKTVTDKIHANKTVPLTQKIIAQEFSHSQI